MILLLDSSSKKSECPFIAYCADYSSKNSICKNIRNAALQCPIFWEFVVYNQKNNIAIESPTSKGSSAKD